MRSVPLSVAFNGCDNARGLEGEPDVSNEFRDMLETFDNPYVGREYTIEHTAPEFTSMCPKTGQPDFGTLIFTYVPDQVCIELKSLKLYLQSFRSEGIVYEAVTNEICDHLAEAMKPRWMIVQTDWRGRGGIRSRIRAEVGDVPGHERH